MGRDDERQRSGETPQWAKVFAVVLGLLVLLFVMVASFGGGSHGPGRHLGAATVLEDVSAV